MGLVGYNKSFLKLTVGAPGSTGDARFLCSTGLFKQILNRQGLPDKTVDLGDEYGKIPLVAIGDLAFPSFSWLLKNFNCNTNDERERYYDIKMNSARVVTVNCYGMLKSHWRILYKKAESKVFNVKYVIMACMMLHNFCIAKHDPCIPRWRLSVEELEVSNTAIKRRPSKGESNKNAPKITTGYERKLNWNVSILLFLNYKCYTTGYL